MGELKIALAGNPNVGKSTLFNALTGLHQHTGNWPGKTVGVASGYYRKGDMKMEILDLPGIYGLNGASEDERLAAGYLESNQADCTVVVCDATALERTLILAIQILERTQSVILCVNMMDEATSRGFFVDGEKLRQQMGVPVVLTSAGKKHGLHDLTEHILHLQDLRFSPKCWYDPVQQAKEIAGLCVSQGEQDDDWRLTLDRILVSRRRGLPILLLLLFCIVFLTVWGANYPSMLLEWLFDGGYIWLSRLTISFPWWLRGILLDGIYATTARVMAVMLPPMAIFFPLFTILEDVGYLPRMAFLMDGALERCGGCGRQALTMCMGLGCNAVGVTGCRIIDSPKSRLAAILTNVMIPCNGRFPTLIVLSSLIFPRGLDGVAVAGFVVLGVLGAMVSTGMLHKTVLRHENTPFIMELPPFRRPRIGQILIRSLLDRTVIVAARAMSVAAPAGAVLWLLDNGGALQSLAAGMDGLGMIIGMNGVVLLAFILSLPANELLIPVMVMIAGTSVLGDLPDTVVVSTMIFTVFHWPCATTLLTIWKETGSKAKTAVAFLMPTAVGMLICMLFNFVQLFLH